MANKELTEKQLEMLIKYVLEPSSLASLDKKDMADLVSGLNKPTSASDTAYLIKSIVERENVEILREVAILERILIGKKLITKEDIHKYAIKYDKEVEASMNKNTEKIKEQKQKETVDPKLKVVNKSKESTKK